VTTHDGELWAKQIDAPDRSFTHRDETTYVPGVLASEGTYVYCKCGCKEALRPVGMSRAIDHARRLCDRVEELGVEIDENVFLDEVRDRMSRPENQCQLDSVLEKALKCSKLREPS
jgi:hypothetical protein